MALTVLSDVILSERVIRAGIRGKTMRRNARSVTVSGRQQANVLWSQSLREYELGFIPMDPENWQLLESYFEVTDGGAYGFLLKDPKDHTTDITSGVIVEENGVFQMKKRYTVGVRTRDRKITRPLSGATVYIDGVAAAATYSSTTGQVTFSESPTGGVLRWAGSFYTPVHFANDDLDWDVVRPGAALETRLIAGPSVVLQEVRE